MGRQVSNEKQRFEIQLAGQIDYYSGIERLAEQL
jgi:hypothetical protein